MRDEAALRHFVEPISLSPVPGHDRGSAIVAHYGNQYSELWLDPNCKRNRLLHLAFFKSINVEVPKTVLDSCASDHAFPRSAGKNEVGFTLMNFIDRSVNSSYGGGWEKRQTHRVIDGGVGRANLVDLGKALGHRLIDARDFPNSIRRLPDLLIDAGQAPLGDQEWLRAQATQALEDWKQQDIAYAIKTGQIEL